MADMVPIKSLYSVSGSTRLEPGEKYSVCMASLLSSNHRNSAYFDNIRLKLPKHAYFEVRFHPILSKYENSKNRVYDVTTNYFCSK